MLKVRGSTKISILILLYLFENLSVLFRGSGFSNKFLIVKLVRNLLLTVDNGSIIV